MRRFGPRVQITLALLADQIGFFADKGETPPLAGLALIDTGASSTCVDREAAERAGLAVVDSGPIASATHQNEVAPIYAGRLNLAGIPQDIDAKRAYGANFEPQGLIALIGGICRRTACWCTTAPTDRSPCPCENPPARLPGPRVSPPEPLRPPRVVDSPGFGCDISPCLSAGGGARERGGMRSAASAGARSSAG